MRKGCHDDTSTGLTKAHVFTPSSNLLSMTISSHQVIDFFLPVPCDLYFPWRTHPEALVAFVCHCLLLSSAAEASGPCDLYFPWRTHQEALVALVRHCHLLSSAAEASSPSPSSPLICLIQRHRTPLVRSHQCHSTITLPHSSASRCHRITASHLPPPLPLAHDTPLVPRGNHHRLSSNPGRPPLASNFVASCPLPSPSSIHCRRHLYPLICRCRPVSWLIVK